MKEIHITPREVDNEVIFQKTGKSKSFATLCQEFSYSFYPERKL